MTARFSVSQVKDTLVLERIRDGIDPLDTGFGFPRHPNSSVHLLAGDGPKPQAVRLDDIDGGARTVWTPERIVVPLPDTIPAAPRHYVRLRVASYVLMMMVERVEEHTVEVRLDAGPTVDPRILPHVRNLGGVLTGVAAGGAPGAIVTVMPPTAPLGDVVSLLVVGDVVGERHQPVLLESSAGDSAPLTNVASPAPTALVGRLPTAAAYALRPGATHEVVLGSSGLRAPIVPLPAPLEGEFRLVATGFRVGHETYDDILERDGKGDEVFLYAERARMNLLEPLAPPVLEPPVQSRVWGDAEGRPDRIRAGSRGPHGGLRTGDASPGDGFPFELWRGTLRQGRDVAVVTPVVFEWDGANDSAPRSEWRNALLQNVQALAHDALNLVRGRLGLPVLGFVPADAVIQPRELVADALPNGQQPMVTREKPGWPFGGSPGNRPVGMVHERDRIAFYPKVAVLTYETAVLASQTPAPIPLTYRDDHDWLEGEYTVDIRVERLR